MPGGGGWSLTAGVYGCVHTKHDKITFKINVGDETSGLLRDIFERFKRQIAQHCRTTSLDT